MSVNGKSIKKFSAAMDAMRKPDTRLLQTNCDGRPTFWIAPVVAAFEPEIAKRIIAHPQIIGGKDALFPGHHQTWRMRPLRKINAAD
jgi:hypothetical protein